jgi:hypothetical protein
LNSRVLATAGTVANRDCSLVEGSTWFASVICLQLSGHMAHCAPVFGAGQHVPDDETDRLRQALCRSLRMLQAIRNHCCARSALPDKTGTEQDGEREHEYHQSQAVRGSGGFGRRNVQRSYDRRGGAGAFDSEAVAALEPSGEIPEELDAQRLHKAQQWRLECLQCR